MAGSDPPRRRGNRLRRSSSSESLVSIRSRSPSPADKKRQNHHLPYWMLAVAIAIALPQRDLLHLPPSIIGTHDYDVNTKSDMFFSPDYSDEHFFDAFKTTQPAGIRWRDDFFKRTPRDAVTVMPILAETRPLIEHHRNHPTHLPSGSSRLSEEPSLEDIELIDVLWRSDLVSDADGSVLEKGTVIARQEEHDLHTLTEKSRIAPLSRDDATRYEELSKGYYEDFYSSVGPHAQAAGCSSETSEKLYVDPSSVASCSSPISPASSASHSSASHSTPSPTVQHKSDLPTDEELEALFDEMLYKDGPLEHLGMSSASVLPNHMHRQQLLHNVSLGIPYAAGNLTDVIPSVQFTPACEPSLPQVPVAAFNSTPFWHHNHTEGPLPGYLRTDGITNLTMAMQHPAANLTEIGALQQNSAAYPQNNISNLAVPCASVGLGGIYDSHYYGRRSISISNESSIESSTSSSSSTSPRYSSEAENHSPLQSRFYGKLLPTPVDEHEKFLYSPDQKNILHSPASFAAVSASAPRRRGRQSKDEQLAAAYRLPASAAHIADMSLPELQKMLRCENLTDEQKTLIRKIRRRGKNKVAARTCRMRRGEMRGPQSQTEHDQHIEMHEWEEPARTLYRRQ